MKADDMSDFVPSQQNNAATKRAQVPKACSNCRKMHAGCEVQRPCRRCKQNGLEASCVDVPRKKRVSRKKQKLNQSEDQQEQEEASQQEEERPQPPVQKQQSQSPQNQQPSQQLQLQSVPVKEIVITKNTQQQTPSKTWENTVLQDSTFLAQSNAEPFETITATMSPLFNPDYQPTYSSAQMTPQGLYSEYSDYGHSGLTPSPALQTNPSSSGGSPAPNGDISFLLNQINALKESNKMLESKLSGMSNELGEIKSKKPQNQYMSSPWHSFQPQQDLAISVWKNAGYSSNILVECNAKFVELLGYPIETLRDNFSCSKLIRRDVYEPGKNFGREWPKRTQIVTASGLKEAFITINPVHDAHNVVKYYVLHILEVHS